MATHSSILAWEIPWMEEPGGLQSMGSLRVEHDSVTSLSLSKILSHMWIIFRNELFKRENRQALLRMEISRQEYWSGLPFPSPGDFPDPQIELRSLVLQEDSLLPELPGKCLCY